MNTELIARLEAAEVGSRELDIKLALDTEHPYGFDTPEDEDNCPRYTNSLDSALVLGERVLKTAHHIRLDKDALWMVSVWYDPDDAPVGFGASKKPALALCIAILRALDAQETAPL